MKIEDKLHKKRLEGIIDTLVEIPEEYLLTVEEIAAVQIKED